MWFLADYEWITPISTAVAAAIGGGGLVTLITTWMNNRRDDTKEERKFINQTMLDRLTALEARDLECNTRVTRLERQNWDLEREAGALRDRLLDLETNMITAVISANSQMRILKWNQGATLMFGYLETEMMNQDVDILVPGYLKQKHHDAYEHAINDLDAVVDWQKARAAVAVHKDGHEFPIQLFVTSFKNTDGEKFFEARITKTRAQ